MLLFLYNKLILNNIIIKSLTIILINLITLGCSSYPTYDPSYKNEPNIKIKSPKNEVLSRVFKQWEGVPYLFGGNDRFGLDCSAFTKIVYDQAFSLSLPRTTKKQSEIGVKVSFPQARSGDLIFFKISFQKIHVGVYLGNNAFMHASSSKGVIISQLYNPYWAEKLWHFRRIK